MLARLSAVCLIAAASFAGELDTAKSRYFAAVEGDSKALDEARDLFQRLQTADPADPVVLAYSGSIQLLQAAHTMMPWRKGKLAKEGLAQLDDAVKLTPTNLEVRFIRAASTYRLPSFFGRAQQSQEDFDWLATRVAAGVASHALDARLGSAALYHHGLIKEKAGDRDGARAAWKEAARIGENTPAGAAAQKRLQSGG